MRKVYLGDGVYAEIDDSSNLVLSTSNGIQETNRIVLEPETYAALELWVHKLVLKHGEYILNAINK